jgi:hypothetical protein
MVSVLGPLEFLRKEIEEVARAYSKNLEVIISDHSSIKNIKQNYSLPEEVREHATKEREITVREEKTFFGIKNYKTVIALVYPYRSNCVVVCDKSYEELGNKIRDKIWVIEQKALDLWFL